MFCWTDEMMRNILYIAWVWRIVYGTDNILQNTPHIQVEWYNIMHNTISPSEHYYGYE